MTERSIMGIPVNPCINGITKAQAAKINEIDGIKADITEIESQLGNSGKEWLELPFASLEQIEPYLERIIDYDNNTMNYDLLIFIEDVGYSRIIPKDSHITADANIELTEVKLDYEFNNVIASYIFTKYIGIANLLYLDGNTYSTYTEYIGFNANNQIIKGNTDIDLNRSYIRIYVFATDLENL